MQGYIENIILIYNEEFKILFYTFNTFNREKLHLIIEE
jgi:hypothetical protein